MEKEIEINGCISVPSDISQDEVIDQFLQWIESKGWFFGGGFREIVDGYCINRDGTKGKYILDE